MTTPILDQSNALPLGDQRTGLTLTGAERVKMFVGVLLLMVGLVINLQTRTKGINDLRWTYTLARTIMSGENGYSPSILQSAFDRYHTFPGENFMPYPPSTGIVMIPLSLLSLGVTSIGWFFVLTVGTLGGVWLTLRYFAPKMHLGEVVLLMGVAFAAACTRWCFVALQAAPAVNALLAVFLCALSTRREGSALVASTIAICLKVTSGLPFVAMALLQRRFKLAAAMTMLCVLINIGGFARMGGIAAFQDYRQNVARTETKHTALNYPDPHNPYSIARLDWQYLLNGIAPNIPRNQKFAALLTVLGFLWLGSEAWRCRWKVCDTAAVGAFLGPVVCLSLLSVYHHHYEASILILPILGYAFGPTELRDLPGAKQFVWITTPYILFYAVNIEAIVARRFGVGAMLYPRLLGSTVVTLGLFASLTALRHFANRTCAAALQNRSPFNSSTLP